MRVLKQLIISIFLVGYFPAVNADDNATIVQFTERETGIDAYPVRYVIANDLLRIDDNNDDGDYVLYDDKKRIIYSVNHDDLTILVIKNSEWTMPEFKFSRNVSYQKIENAPAINGKSVFSYWLSAGETVCSEAQVVEGFLKRESALLKRYKQTLSAEQVTSLVATPEDMRTPCMLVDQVYNQGSVYSKGFPIQQWHVNGLQRMMTSYKTGVEVAGKLFELPKDYKRYSIGDNLTFGQPGDMSLKHGQPNGMPPAQHQSPAPAGF